MRENRSKVRYGVVGLGVMGARHSEWILQDSSPDFTLGAVSDLRPEVASAVGQKLSVPHYTDPIAMFDSGNCDAVLITTPHYWHPIMTIQAARRGLDVLCEKPLASTIGPAQLMIRECKKNNVALGAMLQYRTRSIMRKIKQMIDSGELGQVYRSSMICSGWYRTQAYYDSGAWRGTWDGEGGGILLNQAPHHLDLFQWFAGMPKKVTAFLSTRLHKIEVENTANIICDYGDGKVGYIYATTAGWPGVERFEFHGDNGALIAEGGKLTFGKLARPLSQDLFENKETRADYMSGPAVTWSDVELPADPRFQHVNVYRAFAANLLRGEPMIATGEESINELMLSNAAYVSGFTGKTVSLPVNAAEVDRLIVRLEKKFSTGRGHGLRAAAQKELDAVLRAGKPKKAAKKATKKIKKAKAAKKPAKKTKKTSKRAARA